MKTENEKINNLEEENKKLRSIVDRVSKIPYDSVFSSPVVDLIKEAKQALIWPRKGLPFNPELTGGFNELEGGVYEIEIPMGQVLQINKDGKGFIDFSVNATFHKAIRRVKINKGDKLRFRSLLDGEIKNDNT